MADARETTATTNNDGGRSVSAAPPPAARGSATIFVTIVLLVVLVASVASFLMSPPASSSPEGKLLMEGAGVEGGRAGAEPVEQAVEEGGIPGFNRRLDAFRAWAKLTWMKLRRSHSDEPRYDDTVGSATEAAKKSLEMGKETAELAAATATRAAEGAVGKAKAKVKGDAAPTSSSDAEL